MSASVLYFNTTTAACQNVTTSFRPSAEVVLVESTFTRYSQQEVKAGGARVDGAGRERYRTGGETPRKSETLRHRLLLNRPILCSVHQPTRVCVGYT